MSNSPRIPKKITDKNGKATTVYVSVDGVDGGIKMTRLSGLKLGAPTSFNENLSVEELANGTFDPKPFLTANGDRVAKGVDNDPFYTFAPQPAFDVSRAPIPSDSNISFHNPYSIDREPKFGNFKKATESTIDYSPRGSKIRVGGEAGKVYRKAADGDWINVNPIGVEKVPNFWFKRKLDEGLNVETAAILDDFEVVNKFEFMGGQIEHQYINGDTVRVEFTDGEGAVEVAYWHTDGNNDILQGRKGTLADVTIAIGRFGNGENPNPDLED